MLDFTRLHSGEMTADELAAGLTPADLRRLTAEMVDAQLALIAGCADQDVTFLPEDPLAYDKHAATPDELRMPWTLGHVIVHATASSEECAFLAAELARGVSERPGRSRYETPWPNLTTIGQCRRRLAESRRMRLAALELWPDPPQAGATYRFRPDGQVFHAAGLFIYGLYHDDCHLDQIADIVRQASAARAQNLSHGAHP